VERLEVVECAGVEQIETIKKYRIGKKECYKSKKTEQYSA
jgi:hypothetical protein